jgi:D-glycero-D-manno-heptose 1,7-bisphosphate phosphatase
MQPNEIQAQDKYLYVFDKDGCLCKSVIEPRTGKSHAPNRLEDQDYFEDVRAVCEILRAAGHTLAVASNQGGVAFGIFSAEEAELLVKSAAEYIGAKAYRVCFHHPKGKIMPYNTESPNRKPAPGMLLDLMQQFHVTPEQTVMVGDWPTDQEAARAAGCHFRWAHEFFGRVSPFADRFHAALDMK